jgi:hypothetical protein
MDRHRSLVIRDIMNLVARRIPVVPALTGDASPANGLCAPFDNVSSLDGSRVP